MAYRTFDVSVDIDTDEFLPEIPTKDLEEELKRRVGTDIPANETKALYENLYYALRDADLEKAIAAARPLIEDNIGKIL